MKKTELDQGNVVDYRPGTFGCHEALDRCSLFAEIIAEFSDHPALIQNVEWHRKASLAADTLMDLYQEIGAVHLLATDAQSQIEEPTPSATRTDQHGSADA
jgi:hypothetical protein